MRRRPPVFLLPVLVACLGSSALAQEEAPPEEILPDTGVRVDPRTLEAVFVVETTAGRSLGFLVDLSGLLLTGTHVVESGNLIRVRPGPGRRLAAHSVAISHYLGVAVIRINPAAIAGLRPVTLPGREAKGPDRRAGIVAIRLQPEGTALFGVEGVVREAGASRIRHTAPIGVEDIGGPVLDAQGVVIAVNTEILRSEKAPTGAVQIEALRRLLSEAQERAAVLDPPPAEPIPVLAREITAQGEERGQPPPSLNVFDYRIRSGEVGIEFLTPRLIDALMRHTEGSVVAGEAPWRWERHAGAREPVVIVQVVPDLKWTGGSYAAVVLRIVSYPILVALFAVVFLLTAFSGENDFWLFEAASPVWRPVRAAYHFQGDFEGARLFSAGTEIRPIDAQRLCEPAEVYMSRKATQKPRWRTIRGCWGIYSYPFQVFETGVPMEIRLFEEGDEGEPRTVPIDPGLVERIWNDFQEIAAPPD